MSWNFGQVFSLCSFCIQSPSYKYAMLCLCSDLTEEMKTKPLSFVSPINKRVSIDQLQPRRALKAEFTGSISWKLVGHFGTRASFGPCFPGTGWTFSFIFRSEKEKEVKILECKTFDSTSGLNPESSGVALMLRVMLPVWSVIVLESRIFFFSLETWLWARRVGRAVKGTCCSYRGLGLKS